MKARVHHTRLMHLRELPKSKVTLQGCGSAMFQLIQALNMRPITAHFTNHCPNRTAGFSLIALVSVCAIVSVPGHLWFGVAKRQLPVRRSPSYIGARPRNLNLKESNEMAEIQNDPVASVIEDLYPLAQVAKILRCSRKSVYRLISTSVARNSWHQRSLV